MILRTVYGDGGYDVNMPFDNASMWWDGNQRSVMKAVGTQAVKVRDFNDTENAVVDAAAAAAARPAQEADWRVQLAQGIQALRDAATAAQNAVGMAQARATAADGDAAAATSLMNQAAGLATTGSTAEIRALAEGLRQMAQWRGAVDASLEAAWNLLAALCQNAVSTDQAIIYLAQLAQREEP